MQEDDENRSQPHFVLDRVSPVLTLFASNDLSSSPTNDSEALQERKTLQDAITYVRTSRDQ